MQAELIAQSEMSPTELITEEQINQMQDVRGWLSHLYMYCLEERGLIIKSKHNKADKDAINSRLFAIREYRKKLPVEIVTGNVNMWHTWLIVYVLMFHDNGWKNIRYNDLPKLDSYILVQLVCDKLFDGQNVSDIAKEFKIRAKEKNVLRDFALRLSP
jgi:hypothetical protein